MPVTHGGVVMAADTGVGVGGGRSGRQGGAGAAQCTGLLGAIGSPVIDRGGQQLRQSQWRTLCPLGFSPFKVLAGFRTPRDLWLQILFD